MSQTTFPITLNGEDHTVATQSDHESLSLGVLLESLEMNMSAKGVAIAINDTVVPRSQWPATMLERGDRVELIRATQGG